MTKPTRIRRSTWIVVALVTLIVIAHVFLWRSDMPTGQKLTWTLLNTLTWTVILAPIFFVDRWLTSVRAKNRAGQPEDERG